MATRCCYKFCCSVYASMVYYVFCLFSKEGLGYLSTTNGNKTGKTKRHTLMNSTRQQQRTNNKARRQQRDIEGDT